MERQTTQLTNQPPPTLLSIIRCTIINDIDDESIAAAVVADTALLPGVNKPHSSSVALPIRETDPASGITTWAVKSYLCGAEDFVEGWATLLVGFMDYARGCSAGRLTTAAINAQESRVNAS